MIKRIKNFFTKIGYMFAFGMKGGDDIITNSDPSEDTIGVFQDQGTKNLGEALMKGELTQEVEELRYKDYKISREANNYAYIGDGKAIKRKKPSRNLNNFMFIQGNGSICEGVMHELNRVDSYSTDRYSFEIVYSDITTIRLEAYCAYGKFTIKDNHIKVELFFDKNIRSNIDPITKILLRRLKEISQYTNGHQIENDDLCKNVSMLTFTTYKATNEDDYIQYIISNLYYSSCKELPDAFVITYESDSFIRTDLAEKFYSKTMDEKYQENAPKPKNISIFEEHRKSYCSECGKEIDNYDADITHYSYGRPLCVDCLKKRVQNS